MGRDEQSWLMLAAAALAGGKSHSQAAEHADKVLAAAKSRFPANDDRD